jgi:WD40 repeat protein
MDGYLKAWQLDRLFSDAWEHNRKPRPGVGGGEKRGGEAHGLARGDVYADEPVRMVYTRHAVSLKVEGDYSERVGSGVGGAGWLDSALRQSMLRGALDRKGPGEQEGQGVRSSDGAVRQGVRCFAVADGVICTGGADGVVRLWDEGSFQLIDELTGHSGGVCDLATWDGLLCSLSCMEERKGERLLLWDLAARTCTAALDVPEGDCCCAIGAAGMLATGGASGVVTIWDVSTGRSLFSLDAHAGPITTLVWLPTKDGCQLEGGHGILYTGSHDKTVRAWDLSSQREISTNLCIHGVEVLCVALLRHVEDWSGDGLEGMAERVTVLSGCADGTVKEWRLQEKGSAVLAQEHERDLYS